jgi:hypothetical protein
MNTKPNLQAEAAYETAHIVAQDLVARIQEILTDMPAPEDDAQPIHWGHVGDLTYVNAQLSELVSFFNGRNRLPQNHGEPNDDPKRND